MRITPGRPATGSAAAVSLWDRVLFMILAAVVFVRPLMSEAFERLEFGFLAGIADGGPTPAATVLLDSLLLVTSAAALMRGGWPARGGRWLLIGCGLLAVAVALSVGAAGNKRVAINAGFNLLAGVVAGAALVRLMRARWMAHLLLAGVLASGCTAAVKCITQRAYEFAEVQESWNEQRGQVEQAGYELDDPVIVNFERRLASNEAFAYLSHSNLAAAHLMTCLIVAVGLFAASSAALRNRRTPEAIAGVLFAGLALVLLASGLWLTNSRGGFVAAGCGVVALVALGVVRQWIAARPRLAATVLLAGYAAVIAAGVIYGVARHGLPTASLEFRWRYWVTAARAALDAPLTGIGRENFAAPFLLHKPPESTEDVRNPHNLWVTLWVELGPLGLAAGAILTAGTIGGALRRLKPPASDSAVEERGLNAQRLLVPTLAFLLAHLIFSGTPLNNQALVVIWLVMLGGPWILSLFILAWATETAGRHGAAVTWLVAGTAGAVIATLIHSLIDFSLCTPAGLTTFIAVAAATFALGAEPSPAVAPASHSSGRGIRIAVVVAAVAHLVLVVGPTCLAERTLDVARWYAQVEDPGSAIAGTLEWGQRAAKVDPWDPATPRAVANTLTRMAGRGDLRDEQRLELLQWAEQFALLAADRNPQAAATFRLLAGMSGRLEDVYLYLARPDEMLKALRSTAAYWQRATELDPTNPRTHIAAAKAWYRVWRDDQSDAYPAASAARDHLETALRMDERRPVGDVIRLRKREVEAAKKLLAEVTAALSTQPESAPAE